MSDSPDEQFGFAPDYDSPVPYMQRTRDYYTAIGYTTPYLAAVVLQQAADQLLALRDRALTRLFNLTLIATASSGFISA